jgi:cytokinin riboside 5'-monophosphate phosphoribohydrolase
MSIKWITLYASSSTALSKKYYQYASEIAYSLAESGFNLVYGGSRIGIMGKVAQVMKSHGAQVIGVIPERIYSQVPQLPEIDELIITETMHQRKAELALRGDAYLCLPGGFGTLEEILEIITQKQLQYHNKPIIISNFNQIFNSLFDQFEKFFSEQFAKEIYRKLYCIESNPQKIVTYFQNYKKSYLPSKWLKKKT